MSRIQILDRYLIVQCCGSKYRYIEFGSGSRILARFGSGSGYRVIQSMLKEKIQNNFREK